MECITLRVHPSHILDDDDYALLTLWREWRGNGMGAGHLPFGGGAGDQPTAVMKSLAVMENAWSALQPKKKDAD